jgi:hypothetical protein
MRVCGRWDGWNPLGDDGRWRGVLSDPLSFPTHSQSPSGTISPTPSSLPPPLLLHPHPTQTVNGGPAHQSNGLQILCPSSFSPRPAAYPCMLYGTAAVVVPCGVDSASSVVPITTQELKQLSQQKTRSQPGRRRPSKWRTLSCLSRPRRS